MNKTCNTSQATCSIVELAQRLLKIPSENPPGNTNDIALEIKSILDPVPGITVELHSEQPPITNIVAKVTGRKPGRRLVLNGHLDTFPVGDPDTWAFSPYGEVYQGRLYGRGVSDMKGGLAASILTMIDLSKHREDWNGELVLTLAGDEETMGILGTQSLLENVEAAKGDAMINADAGSTRVLRFGEKGMLWMKIKAKGQTAHAAHVHLGDNAIDRLIVAMNKISQLRDFPVETPEVISKAIGHACKVSEELSGVGESNTLTTITVNYGTINGGSLQNLIAENAQVTVDIRIPVGVAVSDIENHIDRSLKHIEGIEYEITHRYEANWTDPDHEIVKLTADSCEEILGLRPVINMYAGVPTVICGLTPNNMGCADEYVNINELVSLGEIFTKTAFKFLQA
jgi:succinyl-diaminopimelate desuccinylase